MVEGRSVTLLGKRITFAAEGLFNAVTDNLGDLLAGEPELIVTANIGCLAHLQGGTPVRHWVEILDEGTA